MNPDARTQRALVSAEWLAGVAWTDITSSSNVSRIGRRDRRDLPDGTQAETLIVTFTGGSMYCFRGVPPALIDEGIAADQDPDASVGRMFATRIRGRFQSQHLIVEPPSPAAPVAVAADGALIDVLRVILDRTERLERKLDEIAARLGGKPSG